MKEKNGEHPFGDAGQLIALAAFLTAWVADSYVLEISTFPSSYVPSYIRLPAALIVFTGSVYLLWSSHHVLTGKNRPQRVVTTGVFKYLRHPLYMSAILFYLGLIITTASIITFALWIFIFVFYNFIAGYEEKLMEEKFGEEYRSYKQKTAKWLPKIW
jgi:protein-S-isoprenylcysteine O-methyltransferase Ste14